LIDAHGLDLLLQRMAMERVMQEAKKDGVRIEESDIQTEYDATLELGRTSSAEPLTETRRAQLVERWRIQRGVSEDALRMAMTRQAWLRKLAAARLVVNEQMLKEEFLRLYGAKVECRHIELASIRDAEKVMPFLEAGEEFQMLARRHSINPRTAPTGGLLPPFSRRDPTMPGVLREAAFQLKVGQVSNPIQVDGHYHILRLERHVDPEVIRFEDVRESVERELRARRMPVEMERILSEIQHSTVVSIGDPVLRAQFKERQAAGAIVGPTLK
jgi:foldase protein PrsA